MMLAEVRERPFNRAGWVFELKLDGYRLLAGKEGGTVRLISRNGLDLAATFPEVVKAVAALPAETAVLDGEVVAPDAEGRPSFQLLQQRGKLTRTPDVVRAAARVPVQFYAFDLLGLEGYDLRRLPHTERKALLQQLLNGDDTLRYLEHFPEQGETLFEHVVRLGMEGIVAKKADAPYTAGRSPCWLKIRADRTDDFVVVGYSQPKGSRTGFGALHLAQYVGDRLVYAGRAGSGFSGKQLSQVRARLDKLVRPTPPCDGPVPPGETESALPITAIPDYRTATWVEPVLTCEVRFKEWTREGYLRHPVFLRFRDDKSPRECVRQWPATETAKAGSPDGKARARPPAPKVRAERPTQARAPRRVRVSNLDKVFWPDEGYTKGDLIAYYRDIAPWLMPWLRDRPVVLTRYPDGIRGESFFQKDAPGRVPEWLRTVRIRSQQGGREITYFVCENVEGLEYLANLGTIPLHIWASRLEQLDRPDWCSLDLDPKDAPFSHVIQLAQAARELCEDIGLPSFVKTTGSSGLHVMIPLGNQFTHDQARTMAEVLAQALARAHRRIATTTRAVQKRQGKVYLDYLQNGHGKLLVAPFSVRAVPGAPVSMPLLWEEVRDGLEIRGFTIRNALERMTRLGRDPLAPILDQAPDLAAALIRLQERM